MNRPRKLLKSPGFAYALTAAFLFGASTSASKLLLEKIDPWLLAALLYLGSGLGLSALFVLRRVIKKASFSESPLTCKDSPWLFGATVFGGILAPILLMQGLLKTQAVSASLLLNFEAVFTALTAWFIFKEHFDRRILLGMCFILSGGLILSWAWYPGLENFWGPLLIAGACLCWAIDNNVTRKISSSDPLQIAMIKSLIAGITTLGLALNFGTSWPNMSVLMLAGLVGFLAYGVSLVCFVLALRSIGTARTGALFSIAPFVGAIMSVVFLSETVSLRMAIAGMVMAAGVWLHLTEVHSHEHIHEAMEHEHLHTHDEHHQHAHNPDDPPGEPHNHWHRHEPLTHSHPHYPDIHHRHVH